MLNVPTDEETIEAEIARRIDEVESGAAVLVPHEVVMARIEDKLRKAEKAAVMRPS